ncbi:hypothetical protein HPP92_002105 [Vanilla planifolia]|uniref:Uncharacterized protein n=1 Tax=Vanilla planifolia TaxID=51239 RepID=A0A835RXI4_VANPL|nr:hypothetical protein HPP92_002105 [Vanilla planifolia]
MVGSGCILSRPFDLEAIHMPRRSFADNIGCVVDVLMVTSSVGPPVSLSHREPAASSSASPGSYDGLSRP